MLNGTGKKISQYRELRGLTKTELATRVGWPRATQVAYERGERTPPPHKLEKIAEELEVSVNALRDYGVQSVESVMALLTSVEDVYGLVPSEDGASLVVDPDAGESALMSEALKAWAEKRNEYLEGKMSRYAYEEWKARAW